MKTVLWIISVLCLLIVMDECKGNNQSANTTPLKQERGRFQRGPGIWKVFLQLNQEEKKSLLELQRNEPEKFRLVVKKRLDEILQKEQAAKTAMENLAKQYHKSKNEVEKRELKEKLHAMVMRDYKLNLDNHRKNLEMNRRRIIRMEQELKKRAANVEEIVNAKVDSLLKPPEKK